MGIRITVRRESENRLRVREWTFRYDDRLHALVLDRYADGRRPTTRCRPVRETLWTRDPAERRRTAPDALIGDSAASALLAPDVAQEAAAKFARALRTGLHTEIEAQGLPHDVVR